MSDKTIRKAGDFSKTEKKIIKINDNKHATWRATTFTFFSISISKHILTYTYVIICFIFSFVYMQHVAKLEISQYNASKILKTKMLYFPKNSAHTERVTQCL